MEPRMEWQWSSLNSEADFIVDIWPRAGEHGGQIIAAGTVDEIMKCKESITGQYLNGDKKLY